MGSFSRRNSNIGIPCTLCKLLHKGNNSRPSSSKTLSILVPSGAAPEGEAFVASDMAGEEARTVRRVEGSSPGEAVDTTC